MVIAPAVADDFRQPFARHAEQVGGAVGRVVHRRQAVPPGALALLEVERLESGMVVFRFRVIQVTEAAFGVELAGRDRELLPAAGLAHHVGQSGFPHRAGELRAFLERHRGGDGAEHVLAGGQAEQGVTHVVRRGGGEEDRLDLGVFEHRFEGRITLGALVDFLQSGEALGAELCHRLDDAVRVLVELEAEAEAPADDADTDLAGGRGEAGLAEQAGGGEAGARGRAKTEEIASGAHGVWASSPVHGRRQSPGERKAEVAGGRWPT